MPAPNLNPGKGTFASPPENTADAFPEWLSWAIVLAAVLVALWLWRITPRKKKAHGA